MKPIAWYDPTNGMVSTDNDCPLFTPLGQIWGLYPKEEWVGLTEDEVFALSNTMPYADRFEFAKAIEKIAQIKGVDPAKAQLSFVCADLSDLSQYAKSISTPLYRLLKNYLPGPFTFILPASKQVPKLLQNKKNTIGLRIPDNNIASAIVAALEHPILSASLPGDMVEDYTDPYVIHENFEKLVDIVIDGGIGGMIPSTIIDCTTDDYTVIREGAGVWEG
jgi:tRNA threonylcarbamoyl adenosine modification protein (Sua5/YciO/YrdC/YwlC family)